MQPMSSCRLMAHFMTAATLGVAIGSIYSSAGGTTMFSSNDLASLVSTCAVAVLCTKFTQEAFKANAKISTNVTIWDYQDKSFLTYLATRVEAHSKYSEILKRASDNDEAVLKRGAPALTETGNREELQDLISAIEANPILSTDPEFIIPLKYIKNHM